MEDQKPQLTFLPRRDMFSPKQVGDIFGVCSETVCRWIRRGHLKGFKPGLGKKAPWRITWDALNDFYSRRMAECWQDPGLMEDE